MCQSPLITEGMCKNTGYTGGFCYWDDEKNECLYDIINEDKYDDNEGDYWREYENGTISVHNNQDIADYRKDLSS